MYMQFGVPFAAVEALLTTNPTARARHNDWYGGVWLQAEQSHTAPGVVWLVSLGEDRWVPWVDADAMRVTDAVWNVCWKAPLPQEPRVA